jgi:hypothetical protein
MRYFRIFSIGFTLWLMCLTAASSLTIARVSSRLSQKTSTEDFAKVERVSPIAIKIAVNREAWYRVSGRELFAAGLNRQVATENLQLWVDGGEIPVAISMGKNGRFDEGSALEFYGKGLDSPSSDVRIYWLIAAATPGKRIATEKGDGESSVSVSFTKLVERRDRTTYLSSLLNGEGENFFGAVISNSPVSQILNLCHLASGVTRPTTLDVTLQGVTRQAHQVRVQVNGHRVGSIEFIGQQNRKAEFELNREWLIEGANEVRLTSENGDGDIALVDRIGLHYQHRFQADENRLDLTIQGGERVQIGGFTATSVRAFDVTDANRIYELSGKITGQADRSVTLTVTAPESGERRLVALARGQEAHPFSIKGDCDSHWRDSDKGADLILITCKQFFATFEKYKAQREREGLSVALVDIEDIYDEFNFGNKSPQSLKDFLRFAHTAWRVKPRFILLAGDASFDAKNYLGFGENDLVPTKLIDTRFMEAASDEWLGDFSGDGISELAIGRLPLRSVNEAETLVNKLLNYSKSKPVESALLVADANDEFDFEGGSAELAELLKGQIPIETLSRGRLSASEAKARLLAAINKGQRLVNYFGHGTVDIWRGNLLTAAEARRLTNSSLPVMVMMTCLNGYFNDAALDSLAENLLKAERGGAIAVWTSSAMTASPEQTRLNKALYRILFDAENQDIRLGEAVRQAKRAITDLDIRRTWVLLGDPTLQIK